MRRKLAAQAPLVASVGMIGLAAYWALGSGLFAVNAPPITCGEACSDDLTSACSVFSLAKGDQVFFGGNDDFIEPDSYFWVDPGGAGKYGAIWVGTPDNVQQGVNAVGLAYDATSLPRVATNPHPERLPVSGTYTDYPLLILQGNATVAEVIRWVRSHQRHPYMHDQMQFADAGGDAVVIGPGPDGELIFTRKSQGDGFLVSTNFNVADPNHGEVGWRYPAAESALQKLMDRPGRLTPADAAGVLEAVHVEGSGGWTRSSMLADLPNGVVYLYYFYQFDRPIVLDVAEQLANPPAPGALSQLFPGHVQQEAAKRHGRLQNLAGQCRLLGAGWFTLVAVSVLGFALLKRKREESAFWWPAILILGPVGLLIWGLTTRVGHAAKFRSAGVEATGDLAPTAFGFLVALALILPSQAAQSSEQLQTVLLLGLPLFLGLLLFHGPLLTREASASYPSLIWRRLPHVVVVALLGLAGINALAAPLIGWSTSKCAILDRIDSTLGISWAFVAVGSLAGGVLLYAYQTWALRLGFHAWSASKAEEVGVSSPGWRQLWWWMPLALGALIASAIVGQYLLELLPR